jgi:MscS family membrane protein
VDATFGKVIAFAFILDLTWAVARLLDDLVQEYLVPRVAMSDSKLDDQLLPIVRKVSTILIWIIGIVLAISDAGYNVGTIVAGLGIGGLAFAFAAQETIANLFGGVTIFVDAPFRMGDRIKVNGFEGWVREIGLRTSKLETLDSRRLTIPNSVFSKSVIENVSSEPASKVVEDIGLSLSSSPAQVEAALAILKGLLEADPELEANSTVFFSSITETAFCLSLVLWFTKGSDLALARSRINMGILQAFSSSGIELARPVRVLLGQSKVN